MSYFLNTNKEHIFTKEIQQETSLFSVHVQKIVQQCEQLIVEYCLTTHRCQLIFVAKDLFDTALTSFNQYQFSYAPEKVEYTPECFIIQLSKKELFLLS